MKSGSNERSTVEPANPTVEPAKPIAVKPIAVKPIVEQAKPIILSDWEVQAVMAGLKRQVRRPVTPQPCAFGD